MPKFRKKPVVIEAIKWTGAYYDCDDLPHWVNGAIEDGVLDPHSDDFGTSDVPRDIAVRTPEGEMWASPGDWIIRGVKGELYPCKPDIFAATYEPA